MWARVLVSATFVTESPLHIGSGDVVHREGLTVSGDSAERGERVDVSAAATAWRDGRLVAALPGSTLRGALRALLEPADELRAVRLFGTQDGAGMLACWDAPASSSHAPACPPPHWDPGRRTGVRASVALDPVLGTADEGLLRHLEVVPEGESFEVTLALRSAVASDRTHPVTEDDVAWALATLYALGEGASHLGANGADGWGRVTLSGEPGVRAATADSVRDWVTRGAPGNWIEAPPPLAAEARLELDRRARDLSTRMSTAGSEIRADLTLRFSGPLMVAGARTKQEEDADAPDTATVLTATGQVVLPADSARGRLRAQAYRILRTQADADELSGEAASLADALFGTTGGMSALRLSAFLPVPGSGYVPYDQQFVALDRFTGGAARQRLFRWRSAWQPVLRGRIALDTARFLRGRFGCAPAAVPAEERERALSQALGLMALVFRDLAEGGIQFGAGRSKGYGWCTGSVERVTAGDGAELPAALAALLDVQAAGRARPEVTETLAACVDTLPQCTPASILTEADALPDLSEAQFPPGADVPAAGQGGGSGFRNPYHFVPLAESDDPDETIPSLREHELAADGGTRRDHVARSHLARHRWHPGTCSGTITCELRVVTPTVIGGARVAIPRDEAHRVEPARAPALDGSPGAPILPGSTSRGLVSSVFEAATNSALRVLTDRLLTYRASMKNALPYIGAVKRTEDGRWWVLPLCPGALQRGRPKTRDEELFPHPNLRISLAGEIVEHVRSAAGAPTGGFYGLRMAVPPLDFCNWDDTSTLGQDLHWRAGRLLGRVFSGTAADLRPWDEIPDADRPQYVRGRLLVLGAQGRDLPHTKTHEYFVPWPMSIDQPSDWRMVRLPENVRDQFHEMADEVFDEDARGTERRPYEPIGQGRNPDPGDGRLRLKPDDLVWFTADKAETGVYRVTRIALSSVWRSAVGDAGHPGTVHEFFADVDEELLPFNPDRETLSIAEAVFGFTMEGDAPGAEREARPLRAYASRVAFSFGDLCSIPAGGPLEADLTLRALMSPKPPSPEMYFRPVSDERGGRVAPAKEELRLRGNDGGDGAGGSQRFSPQGRKFYLHQSPVGRPWRTVQEQEFRRLKSVVTPLRPETVFQFRVRYDGLTERELGLLLLALEPSDRFHHKIGMGRAIGLGTVRLSVTAVDGADPTKRYSASGYRAPYVRDHSASWRALRDRAAELAELSLPDGYRALLLIGESVGLTDVSTPVVQGQPLRSESETFKWWVANRTERSYLPPLTSGDVSLPRLLRLPRR